MSDTEIVGTVEKRGRGRPKKDSSVILNKSENNGGIETINNGNEVKKRGRKASPQKQTVVENSGPSDGKRGRGRPKANIGIASKAVKSGNKGSAKKGGKRGRPKKTESVEEEAAPLDEDDNDADASPEDDFDED